MSTVRLPVPPLSHVTLPQLRGDITPLLSYERCAFQLHNFTSATMSGTKRETRRLRNTAAWGDVTSGRLLTGYNLTSERSNPATGRVRAYQR